MSLEDDCITGILKDESGDIARLVKMGITESAILKYIVRTHEDKSKERALKALLAGRSLTQEQIDYITSVLDRFPVG